MNSIRISLIRTYSHTLAHTHTHTPSPCHSPVLSHRGGEPPRLLGSRSNRCPRKAQRTGSGVVVGSGGAEQGVARVGNTHHTAARRVRFPQPWWPQLGCTPSSKEPSKCGKTFRVWEGQSPTPCKSSLQAGDWRARRDREDVGCFSSGAPLEPRHPLPQHCRLSTASGCLSAAA